MPIFAWNVPLVSLIFLKRFQIFPTLLFSSISLHWSLKKAFLSLLAILGTLHSNGNIFPFLFCFLLLFFSQVFVRPLQTAILLFCISFSWGWSLSLPPVQCHEHLSIVLQALCLSDLIPSIYFSLPLYNRYGIWFRSYLNGQMRSKYIKVPKTLSDIVSYSGLLPQASVSVWLWD